MKVLNQASGRNWHLYHGDAVEVMRGLPTNSVGLSVYSPPFSQLYIYSDSVADLGNSADHAEFARHYEYVVHELFRITKPGRLCCVHCKDLPLYKTRDHEMGLYPLPDDITRVHRDHGWTLHSRITIWKDPVTEMQRTKNHGLLYKELCKDSCGSRQGMADYVLVFRKWDGEFCDPVREDQREERFDHYVGLNPPDPQEIAQQFGFMVPAADKWGRWPKINPFPLGSEAYRIWSIKCWQKYASPVWFDINQMDTLNEEAARENKDCKHICPLQFDVIERCVHLWSNPGDVIFSPFAGIGSELYAGLQTGRKSIGIELKESYFEQALRYLSILENELGQPTLFDGIEQANVVPDLPAVPGNGPGPNGQGDPAPVLVATVPESGLPAQVGGARKSRKRRAAVPDQGELIK